MRPTAEENAWPENTYRFWNREINCAAGINWVVQQLWDDRIKTPDTYSYRINRAEEEMSILASQMLQETQGIIDGV